jgi:glycosyltransferase involved in cell wall biosynthesis
MQTASLLPSRVLMICDDTQIDRRILQEADTLAGRGCEVLIAGRSSAQLPRREFRGAVRIERLANTSANRSAELRAAFRHGLDREQRAPKPPTDLAEASRELASLLPHSEIAVPEFPVWLEARGKLTRNLVKALLWPPLRLDLLRRLLPGLPVPIAYLFYLPTLLLTPWPPAIRWHWARLKAHIAPWLPAPMRRKLQLQVRLFENIRQQALEERASCFSDLDGWELTLFDFGCRYRPDVVHVHDLPQLRAGCFIARRLGISVIYDAHELYPVIHTLTHDQQERLKAIERHFIREVAHSITVNPFIAARMAQDYGIRTPTVILNAAPPEAMARGGGRLDMLRQGLGLSADQRILIFQGWISIDRRLGDLVTAMAKVQEWIHLVLLGYGDDIPKLRRLALDLGLESRVHFLAAVPQSELMGWVASADAGIIPYQPIDDNHLYCSPNKLFEYIAAGVPIIANDLPFLRQVVAENGFGVVKVLVASSDYADAITEMFDPASGGAERFHDALDNGAEPFLWPAQACVLLDVYADMWRSRQPVQDSPRVEVAALIARTGDDVRPAAAGAPRIFHGLHNIAGIPSIMARAERKLGLASTAVCFPSAGFGYRGDIEESPTARRSVLTERFERHAEAFDVFVFHFGSSLANESLVDIPLLKRMGKRVILYFHGCDIRDSAETIRKYEFSACKVCRPRRCNANRELALEMAMRQADAVWVSTPDLLEFVPGAELFPQPLELERFPLRNAQADVIEAQGDPVVLVHAPSSAMLKGSRHVIRAAEAIRARGEPLELLLLQGLTHEELRSRIAGADIAVDQLLIGSYGMFAVEAMATGIPVICYLRDDLRDLYPELPPLLSANPLTIEQTIIAMMNDPERCQSATIAGRAYVVRHHSADVAARRSLATYERICGVKHHGAAEKDSKSQLS